MTVIEQIADAIGNLDVPQMDAKCVKPQARHVVDIAVDSLFMADAEAVDGAVGMGEGRV